MNLIVAVDNNWGIGSNNGLLYNLKQDMNYFKEKTTDKVVVMGDRTLASFPGGNPLKNRINVCISDNPNFKKEGVTVVNSLQELFETLSFYESENIFVIGGAYVYKQLLPYCHRAYITKIKSEKPADRFFPNLDADENWILDKASDPCYENETVFYFCEYVNKNPQKFNYGYEKPDII